MRVFAKEQGEVIKIKLENKRETFSCTGLGAEEYADISFNSSSVVLKVVN